jgi:hypothetical protein
MFICLCRNVFQYPHGSRFFKKQSIDTTNQTNKLRSVVSSQTPEEKKSEFDICGSGHHH